MQQTNSKQEELVDKIIDSFLQYWEAKKVEKEVEEKMDRGIKIMQSISRFRAADRMMDVTQFAIIKSITDDMEVRKQYVRATLPQYIPDLLSAGEEG